MESHGLKEVSIGVGGGQELPGPSWLGGWLAY